MKHGEDEKRMSSDAEEISKIISELPPEYVRKVKIYAQTLEEIFRSRRSAEQ